jgi:hypothetical protein
LEVLTRKIEIELTNSSRVGNINDAAYLTSSKPVQKEEQQPVKEAISGSIDKKYDWYQNPTHVFISYKVSSPEVSQDADV